ncbi:MAG: ABC transporter permease, partial [Defluviitaleaceae bacterium]|nr:ABC transporter permease [Defluviitaleaceae bacterium]
HQYLLGTGGFLLLAASVTSAVFTLIGDFTAAEALKFFAVLGSGSCASIILGTSIGMISKNQQSATAIGMPVALVVGFAPMVAPFNETVEKFAGVLYTQQMNVVVNDFNASLAGPFLVIAANAAVCAAFFVYAYRKRGLKG